MCIVEGSYLHFELSMGKCNSVITISLSLVFTMADSSMNKYVGRIGNDSANKNVSPLSSREYISSEVVRGRIGCFLPVDLALRNIGGGLSVEGMVVWRRLCFHLIGQF